MQCTKNTDRFQMNNNSNPCCRRPHRCRRCRFPRCNSCPPHSPLSRYCLHCHASYHPCVAPQERSHIVRCLDPVTKSPLSFPQKPVPSLSTLSSPCACAPLVPPFPSRLSLPLLLLPLLRNFQTKKVSLCSMPLFLIGAKLFD